MEFQVRKIDEQELFYEVVKDINIENVNEAFNNLSEIDKQDLILAMERYKFSLDDMANPQTGEIAEVFGSGGGTQIEFETSVEWYEKMGLLKEIK